MIEEFRENLERLRKEAGLSQEALSQKCHYDKTYVGKIERGDTNPSVEAILRISETLNVPPVRLFQTEISDSPTRFSQQLNQEPDRVGRLFVNMFEHSPSIFLLTTDEGIILQINNTAERILKVDSNDIVGRAIHELSFWSQSVVSPDEIRDLIDIGSIGKQATRQVQLHYKGREVTLQIQVSSASPEEDSDQFVAFQLLFIGNTLNRTVMGDHFDLLRS